MYKNNFNYSKTEKDWGIPLSMLSPLYWNSLGRRSLPRRGNAWLLESRRPQTARQTCRMKNLFAKCIQLSYMVDIWSLFLALVMEQENQKIFETAAFRGLMRAFAVARPASWYRLPKDVRSSPLLFVFHMWLKGHLFNVVTLFNFIKSIRWGPTSLWWAI